MYYNETTTKRETKKYIIIIIINIIYYILYIIYIFILYTLDYIFRQYICLNILSINIYIIDLHDAIKITVYEYNKRMKGACECDE